MFVVVVGEQFKRSRRAEIRSRSKAARRASTSPATISKRDYTLACDRFDSGKSQTTRPATGSDRFNALHPRNKTTPYIHTNPCPARQPNVDCESEYTTQYT